MMGRAATVYSLNPYLLTIANPVNMWYNGYNIETSIPLAYDRDGLSKWDLFWHGVGSWYNGLHWGWKVGVGAGLFLAGLGLTVLSGGAALPIILNFGIGIATGTAINTGINLVMGADFGDALLGGFADSVLWSGVFTFASASVNAIRRIPAYRFLRASGLKHSQTRQALRAFKGVPKVTTLQADAIAYRSWGDGARMLSHWVSPNNYGASARSLLSIPATNSMEFTSTFLIQSGTQVLAGTAAPLFGQIGGGIQWWVALLTL